MAVRCDTCGVVVKGYVDDHRCGIIAVVGHCEHHLDLTPEQCGTCEIERMKKLISDLEVALLAAQDRARTAEKRVAELEAYVAWARTCNCHNYKIKVGTHMSSCQCKEDAE